MKEQLSSNVQKRIQDWLDGPFDEETKSEIKRFLKENPKELSSAFFKDLSFGTGGMRGIMGIGTNRINVYTIRKATQGLANYLKKEPPSSDLKVFIGFDVRHHSKEFAEETAKVLAGNGIGAILSQEICPTPLVSFACRHLQCSAAIMITASHNPPEYNGYKVYWSDGAQIVPPHDVGIVEEVNQVKEIHLASSDSSKIQRMGKEIDKAYLKELKKLIFRPDVSRKSLTLLYSNLHGTGIRLIGDALKTWGFSSLLWVEAQKSPDADFKNARTPNPEEDEALELGAKQLLETKTDLLLATDPDADRVGVVVRTKEKTIRLTGNQIACLCLHHICISLKKKEEFPPNAGFIKTIVTTELFKAIASDFGGTSIDVLTGFKYIAEMIRQWENSFNGLQFLFGAEESLGYLFGTFVRDKDGISASCLIAEMAATLKAEKKTLVDGLCDLYRKYGVYRDALTSLSFSDTPVGMKQTQDLMERLRKNPHTKIGNISVSSSEDFSQGILSLPKSDVLRFWLSDGSKLVIRPSGTEPKIKIYGEVFEKPSSDLEKTIADCDERLKILLQTFKTLCSH
ncbi:MAG: phospho-sugar mutase [Chlamydiae bacterium]|nr:phospho-sugar mutase [Chlamydiota bacterium]